jgi:hypothetical protein
MIMMSIFKLYIPLELFTSFTGLTISNLENINNFNYCINTKPTYCLTLVGETWIGIFFKVGEWYVKIFSEFDKFPDPSVMGNTGMLSDKENIFAYFWIMAA